jgi:YVTN family beta-propeller protein
VTKLSLTGTVIGTYPVQTAPAGIVFDGRYIWVTNSGSNTISQLDYTNGALIGSYPVNNSPIGVCFDGNAIWVANETSGNLLRR